MTIRTKLQAILIVLFVFIIGLVGLNFSTFNELKGDSPAVNASGSLRMRAYQLSWLSARLVSADEEQAAALRKTMQEYITTYDRILAGLEKGDAELNLLPVEDAAVQQQLAAVKPLWESYRSDVRAVSDAADEETRRTADAKVAGEVASYVAEVNKLVAAYDAASQAKIAMSKNIQLGVIVLALFIVGGALWLILVQILRPLAALTKSFSEIAEGEGDLTQQLHAERDDEIGRIVRYFNTFIGKLRTIMRGAQESAAEVSSLSTALSPPAGRPAATPRMMISILRSRPPRSSQLSFGVSASGRSGARLVAASRLASSSPVESSWPEEKALGSGSCPAVGAGSPERPTGERMISICACVEMTVSPTKSRTTPASSAPSPPSTRT